MSSNPPIASKEIERVSLPTYYVAHVFFAIQLMWVILMSGLAISKIVAIEMGFISYISHITNWSWTLAILFYAGTLPFFVLPSTNTCFDMNFAAGTVKWCFFPLNGLVWTIMLMVNVLFFVDPDFIMDLFDNLMPGVVILGNDIFHVYPVLALVFYAAIQHRLIYYALNSKYARASLTSDIILFWWYAYDIIVGALIFVGLYLLALALMGTSVEEIYSPEFSLLYGFAFFVVVSLLVNGIPLLILTCCFKLTRPNEFVEYQQLRVAFRSNEDLLGDDFTSLLHKKYDGSADVPSAQKVSFVMVVVDNTKDVSEELNFY